MPSTATTSGTTRRSRSSGSTSASPASARSRAPSCATSPAPRAPPTCASGPTARVRPVCFDADAGYVDTDVWWRADLLAGDTVEGPAIIEEFGSTVPVHPGFVVRVDTLGNLVITKTTAAQTTPEA